MSDEDKIGWLVRKIKAMGPEFVVTFVDCPQDRLARYNDSLGRMLRNEFKMWDTEWKPEVVNGVDVSPEHPDQRSQRIIEYCWDRLQDG